MLMLSENKSEPQFAGPRAICFQARDTSHAININVRNPTKKVLNHSTGGEPCELKLSLGQCQAFPNSPTFTDTILSQSQATYVNWNWLSLYPISVAERELAQNSRSPHHLLTKLMPKICAEMWDLTSFTTTTFSSSSCPAEFQKDHINGKLRVQGLH